MCEIQHFKKHQRPLWRMKSIDLGLQQISVTFKSWRLMWDLCWQSICTGPLIFRMIVTWVLIGHDFIQALDMALIFSVIADKNLARKMQLNIVFSLQYLWQIYHSKFLLFLFQTITWLCQLKSQLSPAPVVSPNVPPDEANVSSNIRFKVDLKCWLLSTLVDMMSC